MYLLKRGLNLFFSFFVTFNIIISHIFPENSIEVPRVVCSEDVKNFSVNISYFHRFSSIDPPTPRKNLPLKGPVLLRLKHL